METLQGHSSGQKTDVGLARRVWREVFEAAARVTLLDEESIVRLRRIQMVGALGVIGHPLYYAIWTYVFPQPYENLWLRLMCTVLFVPLLFANAFSKRRWLSSYALFAITVGLPFTFIFFYLKNGGTLAWAESVIVAIVILFHFDTAFAVLSLLLGIVAAVALFLAMGSAMAGVPWEPLLLQLPIIVFVIAVLIVIKLDRQLLTEQKRRGMAAALATVAHELRTPLTSLMMSTNGLKSRLPEVLAIGVRQRDAVLGAIERMEADLAHVANSIELLVANSRDPHTAKQELFELNGAIRGAIERYPFEPGASGRVSMDMPRGAFVMGNAQLFELVITNLTKNALEAIKRAGKGDIWIRCEVRSNAVHVLFRDTATGVPSHVLPRMFQPFFSYPSHRGTGIGLAFCREVLCSFGASISCSSVEHMFTEFDICFPRP